jgi:large subunit ribosomal protein L9
MAHAEVILTENIPSLGAEADLVKVRRGYARNFLLPRGKAIEATGASVRLINHLQAKRAEREAREVTAAEDLARRINKLHLNFELETGQGGKAFGSVTARDITERLEAELKDVILPKHAVTLEKPIKESGEHQVGVKIHADVSATVRLTIAAPAKAAPAADDRPARRRADAVLESAGQD